MRRSPQPVSESLIPTRFSFPSSSSSFPLAFLAKLSRSRADTINEKKWTSMKSHEISLHINQTYWFTRNDLLFLLMLSSCRTKYFLCPFSSFFFSSFFLKKTTLVPFDSASLKTVLIFQRLWSRAILRSKTDTRLDNPIKRRRNWNIGKNTAPIIIALRRSS